MPVSIAIALLLAIVAFSYRQVCIAYPNGGGSYSVSKANFGRIASLVAASALLIDYNLTAAVSTSSAVEQIMSAFPALATISVGIGVGALALITLANLRGVARGRQHLRGPDLPVHVQRVPDDRHRARTGSSSSASTRAPPPEVIVAATDTTAGGRHRRAPARLRVGRRGPDRHRGDRHRRPGIQAAGGRNAATTLLVMAGVLAVLFVGITFLASNFGILPDRSGPRRAQDGHRPGRRGRVRQDSIGFYLFQTFTALLLFLAANTSFAAFPRLAAVLGEDGFFPRQFSLRGDRLAFSMGIVALGIIAASLVMIAGGDTHALIPLYAVGVFIDFTISQAGMIRHWLRTRERRAGDGA